MTYKRLGDILLSVGLINEDQLNAALEKQKETKQRLGDVLISEGIVTELQIIEVLQIQLGVEFVDLSKTIIPPEMAELVPKAIAKKNNLVPVKKVKDELYIAMSDPLNFYAIEDVKKVSHSKVIPMIATSDSVARAVLTLYGNEGAAKAIEEMKRSAANEATPVFDTQVNTTVIAGDENAAPVIRLVNSIIERAVTERASDIHLEARDEDMVVRIRVDGLLRNILTVPRDLQGSVIARLKVMGGMNTSEKRIPQDGRANVISKGKDIDLRISTLPTVFGEKMVIRLLDKSGQVLTRQGIGMDEYNDKRFDELLRNTSGVILIAGPTGSGKSSTMTTMVRELNTESVNIVTLEDPVEYNIDGVNQVQINEKTGMTFAGGLRSILRQDPDIIAVGEIRDGETAEIAMRAAITGHLVLSTIHTHDALSVLDRLDDIGVQPYLTAAALKGVVAQRLVRKVCPDCKTEYMPTEEELEILGISNTSGIKFYKGAGCPSCFHTGYKGRTGVFEILLINNKIHKMILERSDTKDIAKIVKEDGFVSITERCREMVIQGVTTVEEACRTIYSTTD